MAERKTSLFDGRGTIGERRMAIQKAAPLLSDRGRALVQEAARTPQIFEMAEKVALSEARAAAHDSGRLFEYTYRDRGGREISTYEGDPDAWMKHFKSPGQGVRIDREVGTHMETVRIKDGERVQIIPAGGK